MTAAPPPPALLSAFEAELGGSAAAAAADFLAQAAQDAREDELRGVGPEDLAAMLAGFWRFADMRIAGAPSLALAAAAGAAGRPLGLDLLMIVQDDAPFLVDSLMGELAEAGLDVRAMFHPVVSVSRDPRRPSLRRRDAARIDDPRRPGRGGGRPARGASGPRARNPGRRAHGGG